VHGGPCSHNGWLAGWLARAITNDPGDRFVVTALFGETKLQSTPIDCCCSLAAAEVLHAAKLCEFVARGGGSHVARCGPSVQAPARLPLLSTSDASCRTADDYFQT